MGSENGYFVDEDGLIIKSPNQKNRPLLRKMNSIQKSDRGNNKKR